MKTLQNNVNLNIVNAIIKIERAIEIMENQTIAQMIERAVKNASQGSMEVRRYYVYGCKDGIKYSNSLQEALITYIEAEKTASNYLALGVEYDVEGEPFLPLSSDLLNNKLGFTYKCLDCERSHHSELVREGIRVILTLSYETYVHGIKTTDIEAYATWERKRDKHLKEEEARKQEAERIASLPYITLGRYTKCKVLVENEDYKLIMNEEALASSNRQEKRYGYVSVAKCCPSITPLGHDQEHAIKTFKERF